MDEDRLIPVNPASTIGAGYGIPIQQPPPIRLPNVGMGAMGMPQWGDGDIAAVDRPIEFDEFEGSGGGDHMWKASSAGESDAEVPVPLYNVLGGIVVVQGTRVAVEDVEELPCAAEGFICLKVTRDTASRAYDAGNPPVIEFLADEPTSADDEEFTILAEIVAEGDATVIKQCRNDEICSYELMLVENGEFKLMPFQTNSRNSYDPPEPEPEP